MGLTALCSCSDDTTASQKQAQPPVTSAIKSEAQTFADLAALRPRDRTSEQDVQLAAYLAVLGRHDEAFASLSDAAVKGFSDLARLQAEPRFAPLRSDSRWQQLEVFVDVNGAQGNLPDRSAEGPETVTPARQMPAGAKVNIPAPDWALTNAQGKTIRLSDLRGKTVIMDFWATWCGPCKKSMPEIDKFTRQYASPDLLVFSVNVWERSPDVALEWWNQQNYAMTLLYGDRNLTSAYEVMGIPHLCLIDADGIIRYSQAGFHPQVLDVLRKYTASHERKG
jgi:thiol-disulfide isomerase/thioredoxin